MTKLLRDLIIGGALLLAEVVCVTSDESPRTIDGLPDLRKLKSRGERRAAVEAYKERLRPSKSRSHSNFWFDWPEEARRQLDASRERRESSLTPQPSAHLESVIS